MLLWFFQVFVVLSRARLMYSNPFVSKSCMQKEPWIHSKEPYLPLIFFHGQVQCIQIPLCKKKGVSSVLRSLWKANGALLNVFRDLCVDTILKRHSFKHLYKGLYVHSKFAFQKAIYIWPFGRQMLFWMYTRAFAFQKAIYTFKRPQHTFKRAS